VPRHPILDQRRGLVLLLIRIVGGLDLLRRGLDSLFKFDLAVNPVPDGKDFRISVSKEDLIALQGNVDPCVLLGPEEGVRQAAREAVESSGGIGHILNLGHGILQQTPVENARAFVEAGQAAGVSEKVRAEEVG
jgi:uroporphyrinogen decarboxylase